MADVARRAEVSIKTVSRVVNGESGVSPATTMRVREIIELASSDTPGRRCSARGAPTDRPGRPGPREPVLRSARRGDRARGAAAPAPADQHVVPAVRGERGAAGRRPRRPTGGGAGGGADRHHPLGGTARRGPVGAGGLRRPAAARPRRGHDPQRQRGRDAQRGGALAAHRHERIGFLGDDQSIWTARERKSAFDSAAAALVLRGPLRSRVGPYAAGEVAGLLRGVDVRSGSGDGGGYRQQPRHPERPPRHARGRSDALPRRVRRLRAGRRRRPAGDGVHQDPMVLGERAVQQVFARLATGAGEPTTVIVPAPHRPRLGSSHAGRDRGDLIGRAEALPQPADPSDRRARTPAAGGVRRRFWSAFSQRTSR